MHIMNALVAILMTSYFSPDAGLRATNWFKLLRMPQSLIYGRSSQIVIKFPRDDILCPFDIDYVGSKK